MKTYTVDLWASFTCPAKSPAGVRKKIIKLLKSNDFDERNFTIEVSREKPGAKAELDTMPEGRGKLKVERPKRKSHELCRRQPRKSKTKT